MRLRLILLLMLGTLIGGCQSAYYGAMEKVGYHKREILVDRIRDTQESQEEAKEQGDTNVPDETNQVPPAGKWVEKGQTHTSRRERKEERNGHEPYPSRPR